MHSACAGPDAVQVVKSQMDQEAEVMKQSMARQESMPKEEEEAASPAKATSPTSKQAANANRPSESPSSASLHAYFSSNVTVLAACLCIECSKSSSGLACCALIAECRPVNCLHAPSLW